MTPTPNIWHIKAEELLLDSFKLGKKLYQKGLRPNHAISIWRGGTPVGLGVDAYFRIQGLSVSHTTIATDSYTSLGTRGEVTVKGLDHIIRNICTEDRLLIIDDVYETGHTIREIMEILKERARANAPKQIVVATLHRKIGCAEFSGVTVVSLEDIENDVWIDYPHELADLVNIEDSDDPLIKSKDTEIHSIIRSGPTPASNELHGDADAYRYISARELLLDSFRLGVNIASDPDFFPDFIIALWPGGITAGLPIHEVYKYQLKKGLLQGEPPDHVSINTLPASTGHIGTIVGMQYLEENINKDDRILLIDTTFRASRRVNQVISHLKAALKRNLSMENIRVAAVYYNPDDKSTWISEPLVKTPHYYLRLVDGEIIYPQSIYKLPNPKHDLLTLNPKLHQLLYGE